MKKTKRRLPPSLLSVAIEKCKINTLAPTAELKSTNPPKTARERGDDHVRPRRRPRPNFARCTPTNRQEMIMSKSARDRALDVAARRYLTWQVTAGRPPAYNTDDWPDWARTPDLLEAIADRAAELGRAQDPSELAFLTALHRLAASQPDLFEGAA
jgi:hypothetical protein